MDGIIFALGIFILFTFLGYNRLIRLRTNVYKAYDSLDKRVERRNELIEDFIAYLQKAMNNESSKLEELTGLYKKDKNDNLNLAERVKLNNKINKILAELLGAVSNNHDLSNNSEFLQLKEQLTELETQLSEYAGSYNEAVGFYNNAVHMFPSNVFAVMFGFKGMPEFKVGEEKAVDN